MDAIKKMAVDVVKVVVVVVVPITESRKINRAVTVTDMIVRYARAKNQMMAVNK